MVVGKGGAGGKGPLDFENFSKKGCFLSFEWEKTNFITFGHPWKNFGKSPGVPPGKNPSDAHDGKISTYTPVCIYFGVE